MRRWVESAALSVAMLLAASSAQASNSSFGGPPHFDAQQTSPPPQVVVRKLVRKPDIVIASRTADLSLTMIDDDIDWVVPAPDGRAAVAGRNQYTMRMKHRHGGESFRYPGKTPLPVDRVEHLGHVAYSSDGRYLVVTSGRSPVGRYRTKSDLTITVLSPPNMVIVQRVRGVAPVWTGPKELGFRRGSRPFRLTVGGRVTPLGVPRAAVRCLMQYSSVARCPGEYFTNLLRSDPSLTRWLAIDTHRKSRVKRFRLLPFDGSPTQTLLTFAEVGQALRPITLSPDGKRYCGWQYGFASKTSRLLCVSFDDGRVEQLHEVAGDTIGNMRWIDNSRLVFAPDAPVIIDVVAGTSTHVTGLPPGSASAFITPLPGGRRLVAHFSRRAPVMVIDLRQRTYAVAPASAGTAYMVKVAERTDERFAILGGHRASWVDMKPTRRRPLHRRRVNVKPKLRSNSDTR